MRVDGSDLVARALKKQNVKVVFTLSGMPSFGIYHSLIEEGIRLIDVRHEQAAILMAQGYARATGGPAVALVVPGPGVLNAITGIANCYFGSAPVIVLAGQNRIEELELGAFHETPHLELVRPITKWCATAYKSKRIPEYIDMAFRKAVRGMPGPTFVDFPQNVLEDKIKTDVTIPDSSPVLSGPYADPSLLAEAVDLLQDAERPLVVYGSGIIWSDAHSELLQFVETSGIPAVPTPLARGSIPDDHPLSCFNARSYAMAQSDAVLFIGARLNFILGYGRSPRFNPNARTIQVDIAADEIGRNRSIDLGLVGDAKAVLKQFLEQWKRKGNRPKRSWATELKALEEDKKKKWMEWAVSPAKPINPIRLCHEIAKFINRDAVVCIDGGEILDFARTVIPSYAPASRFNPGVTGLLGIGIPYAVGAKLAHPDRQVLCLCGDGAFGLNGMELDTAARHGLPIVVVVSNNSCWGVCVNIQRGTYGDECTFGTQLSCTRYDLIAQGMDCYGETVEEPDQIRPALERAFKAQRPALLNVITDPDTIRYSMSSQLRNLPLYK
ncbi:MAG: thiamine pyrophosphate-binding protein [Syntrophobacteraceae bacterium]|jgi:acetolactate synthase-1/2/3 large subunit